MRLVDWLKQHDVTAPEFAARVGVDRSNVTRWLKGEVRPGWDVLARIVSETGGAVTANDFMPPPPAAASAQSDPPRAA